MKCLDDGCSSNPCMNGGICETVTNAYECKCLDDYSGTNCETNGNSSHDHNSKDNENNNENNEESTTTAAIPVEQNKINNNKQKI